MPFESQAQRGFMYSQHPELAKEFEDKTPKGKKLPNKKKHSKSQQNAIARRLAGGKGSGRN